MEALLNLENCDSLTVFKDKASFYVTSFDHKKIKEIGRTIIDDKDSISTEAGFGKFNEDFTIFTPLDEGFAISMINTYLLRSLDD